MSIRSSLSRPVSPHSRVLVLGGTGFLGSEIVRGFLASGSLVVVLARHAPVGHRPEWLEPVDVIVGAAENPTVLAEALFDVDHVVSTLGCPLPAESNRDPVGDQAKTMPALIHLLEALRSRPGVGLTFMSSGGTIYGNPASIPVSEDAPCEPITPYGITKLTAEKYIGMYSELYGIPAQILRISNPYGPMQSAARGQGVVAAFLRCVSEGSPARIFGDGSVVRDYVDVADVAQAVVRLSLCVDSPRVLNVGSGVGHSIAEVLEIVQTVTGAKLFVERLPQRGSDVRSVVLDVAKLRRVISWQPTTLETGIARTWAALRPLRSKVEERLA